MHPAFSVIFLTTLIGAGQGLFIALYSAEIAAAFDLLPHQDVNFFVYGSALVLLLTGAGLIASFFHLGHPERAWRSAAMWRTSWLSREVIALPAFGAAVLAYGAAHAFGSGGTALIGALAVVLCLVLFICTGMIYACIKFLQEWATPLTVVNYILLGSASGFTLVTALSAINAPALVPTYARGAALLTLAALLTRTASLVRNSRLKPRSTMQTAIGVRHTRIAQKAQGAMGGSFNTREFFHGRKPAFLRSVKWIFLLLVFPVPVVLLLAGMSTLSGALLFGAFALQYLGLIAERWFFFAQANHPQNLYYQAIS